jgi:hypothetical protein
MSAVYFIGLEGGLDFQVVFFQHLDTSRKRLGRRVIMITVVFVPLLTGL